jgi:hypothetical protein
VIAKVVGYVDNPALGLDLPLDIRGTAFQQRVWQLLRDIPAGSTATYTEVAKRIGAPKSARAVARDPLSPRGSHRRQLVRLPLGDRAQADATQERISAVRSGSTAASTISPPSPSQSA